MRSLSVQEVELICGGEDLPDPGREAWQDYLDRQLLFGYPRPTPVPPEKTIPAT